MTEPKDLHELRTDTEARQKSIVWEDQFRNNRSVTKFLCYGDPNATLIQRAGLFLFGMVLLLCSTIAVLSWFENEPDRRTYLSFVFAIIMLFVAGRLFRNAFMKHTLRSADFNDKRT